MVDELGLQKHLATNVPNKALNEIYERAAEALIPAF